MRWIGWGRLVVVAFIWLLAPLLLHAQDFGEIPEVPVRAYVSHDGVAPGGKLRLAVVYEIPADHHLQLNEFLFAQPAEGEIVRLGPPALPPTHDWEGDPILTGKAAVIYEMEVPRETPLGERTVRLLAGYQVCSERPTFACYAPGEAEVSVPIRVVAEGTPVKPQHANLFPRARTPESTDRAPEVSPAGETPSDGGAPAGEGEEPSSEGWLTEAPASDADRSTTESASGAAGESAGLQEGLAAKLRGALAKGSWVAFLLVFFAGFLTSFTPCVYPMIPITIGFVAGRSRGRLSGFILSLFFVLGIAIIYSALGLAAALSGGVFGTALQSTPTLVVIAAVFFLMGISMLGAFDLTLPSTFQTKLQSRRQGGWIGAILMGGVTGLVASPCVGPVLVVLLTWVAQVGRPFYGFSLLFVFALGLGLLFLIIGTFVGAIQSLPRAGAWMETVKHWFGWIFLILGVYYIRLILGPNLTTILYGAILALMATQIGAFAPILPESSKGATWRKGIGVVILTVGILLLAHGILSHYGWRTGGVVAERAVTGDAEVAWRSDESAALADARANGKPVLLDFTAEWCAACHELDKETWSDAAVVRELAGFVTLKLDMTKRNEETSALGERWKVSGLPTVIVLDGDGNEVERFFGFRTPEQVLPLLKRVARG